MKEKLMLESAVEVTPVSDAPAIPFPEAGRFLEEQRIGEKKMEICQTIEVLRKAEALFEVEGWRQGTFFGCMVGGLVSAYAVMGLGR